MLRQAGSNAKEASVSEGGVPLAPVLYARISTGELVLRLGADKPFDNVTMLETGEPVYTPVMQVWPLNQAIIIGFLNSSSCSDPFVRVRT